MLRNNQSDMAEYEGTIDPAIRCKMAAGGVESGLSPLTGDNVQTETATSKHDGAWIHRKGGSQEQMICKLSGDERLRQIGLPKRAVLDWARTSSRVGEMKTRWLPGPGDGSRAVKVWRPRQACSSLALRPPGKVGCRPRASARRVARGDTPRPAMVCSAKPKCHCQREQQNEGARQHAAGLVPAASDVGRPCQTSSWA